MYLLFSHYYCLILQYLHDFELKQQKNYHENYSKISVFIKIFTVWIDYTFYVISHNMAEIWPKTFFSTRISLKVSRRHLYENCNRWSPIGCLRCIKKTCISRVKYHTLMSLVDSIIINPTMYFNLFHAKLVFCLMKSFHTFLNIAHSGCNPSIFMSNHFYTLPKSSCPCLVPTHLTLPTPHFYRSTPNQHSRLCSECSNHLIIHTVML